MLKDFPQARAIARQTEDLVWRLKKDSRRILLNLQIANPNRRGLDNLEAPSPTLGLRSSGLDAYTASTSSGFDDL